MIVLGIETSCDETAVALVGDDRRVPATMLRSQWAQHQHFGGVVPELAARAHLDILPGMVKAVLQQAGISAADIAAVAVTAGPGLIGGLLVGATYGQMLALGWDKPLLALNHLEGHALTPRFCDAVEFPYLLLLVSGGHSQFLWIKGVGDYELLGETLDDAVGEAFDKVAKILGLPQPGGPAIEQAALIGNATRFALPQPLAGRANCDLSLSGLKTAVRQMVGALGPLDAAIVADMAASFQSTVARLLATKLKQAIRQTQCNYVAVAGGVAANNFIRQELQKICTAQGCALLLPPLSLCGDNAVMMAWAGIERLRLGARGDTEFSVRPRWPLHETVLREKIA